MAGEEILQVNIFWARGFSVSTAGIDEETVRDYIRNQEKEDRRLEQLRLV